MRSVIYVFIVGIFFVLEGCAPRVPFTGEIRNKYNLSEAELKQLQFYNSHDITLSQVSEEAKTKQTQDGELKITTGKSYDEVLIKAGTRGVVEKVIDQNRIAVSFEPGSYIIFGDPDHKNYNYTLLAADWRNNRGVLNYGGKEYYANRGAANIYLKFKLSKLNKVQRKSRVVKGRKL